MSIEVVYWFIKVLSWTGNLWTKYLGSISAVQQITTIPATSGNIHLQISKSPSVTDPSMRHMHTDLDAHTRPRPRWWGSHTPFLVWACRTQYPCCGRCGSPSSVQFCSIPHPCHPRCGWVPQSRNWPPSTQDVGYCGAHVLERTLQDSQNIFSANFHFTVWTCDGRHKVILFCGIMPDGFTG